jgi:type II secretory pathway pseudopilin PulG
MNKEREHGFTLLEVLIYIGILLLALTVVVGIFFSLNTVFERNRVERTLAHAAQSVLDRVIYDAYRATTVDTLNSVLNASSSRLTLTQGAATTTAFYIATGTVMVAVNGVEEGPLLPSDVSVDALTFHHFANTFSEAVRVGLTLSVSSKAASTTQTFYTTVVLRSSYE